MMDLFCPCCHYTVTYVFLFDSKLNYTGCPKKFYLILKLYFKAAKLLMSEILAFRAFLDQYNVILYLLAFMALLINGTKLTSTLCFSQNPSSIERYDFLNINFKLEILANFEFLGVSNLLTNC